MKDMQDGVFACGVLDGQLWQWMVFRYFIKSTDPLIAYQRHPEKDSLNLIKMFKQFGINTSDIPKFIEENCFHFDRTKGE
jgi:hypothetical protein